MQSCYGRSYRGLQMWFDSASCHFPCQSCNWFVHIRHWGIRHTRIAWWQWIADSLLLQDSHSPAAKGERMPSWECRTATRLQLRLKNNGFRTWGLPPQSTTETEWQSEDWYANTGRLLVCVCTSNSILSTNRGTTRQNAGVCKYAIQQTWNVSSSCVWLRSYVRQNRRSSNQLRPSLRTLRTVSRTFACN